MQHSVREAAILRELAQVTRSLEIADALGICARTVGTYFRRIMAKLGFASQKELVRYAAALNVLDSAD